MEANLARMAVLARAAGLGLRPHAKTHKSPHVAVRQLAYGASGLTVATLREAEVFAPCIAFFWHVSGKSIPGIY